MSAVRPWYAGNNGAQRDARRYFVLRDGRLGPEYYETPGTHKIAFFPSFETATATAADLNRAAGS